MSNAKDEFKIVEEQEAVLNSSGKSIVVSASAGSGKTSVLTRKISKLLNEEKTHIENVLVLTYTKAAAYEMKQRLNETLLKSAKENKKITMELDGISIADISTFHSFYQKMISKFFFEVNVSPSFKILSQEETTQIKAKAIKKAIKKFKSLHEDEYYNLLQKVCTKRTDDKLCEIVFQIYEFLSSQDNKENWKQNISKLTYQKENNIALEIVREDFLKKLAHEISVFERLQKKAESIDESYAISHINEILSCANMIGADFSFEKILEVLQGVITLPRIVKKNITDENLCAKIDSSKKNLSKLLSLDSFSDFGGVEKIYKSFEDNEKIVSSLLELEELFESEFSVLKEKEDGLDFVDLEQKMLQLLKNEEIRKNISDFYDYVFVDEYQDANSIQDKIISLIAKENNMFLVGDPKQGIYAFRQSDSKIITDKIEQFEVVPYAESKTLNSNFRTDKQILEFDNRVFSLLMSKTTSDIDYKKNSKLVGMADFEKSEICPVEIVAIKQRDEEKDEEKKFEIYSVEKAQATKKDSLAKKECVLIANKISEIVGKKIFSSKEKVMREINFSDIAILLRKRGEFSKLLCACFDEFGIPYSFSVKRNLLKNPEVALLFNYMKLCLNDFDDIALANVLTSNFGGLSFSDLAKIKFEFRDEKNFFDCVLKYKLQKKDEIAKKLQNFYCQLEDSRFEFSEVGVYVHFSLLCEKYMLFSTKLLEDDGISKVERIKSFIDFFANNKFDKNISAFVEFVENNNGEFELNDAGVKASNCVLIDTMHSSKGLEYPIVFLSELGASLDSTMETSSKILIEKDLGIVLRFYDEETKTVFSSVGQRSVEILKRKKEFSEKIRLLYVAMTRAKNAMFLTGSLKKNVEKISREEDVSFVFPRTYLNLICSTLEQNEIEYVNDCKRYVSENLCISSCFEDEIVFDESVREENKSFFSDEFLEKMKKQTNFVYPNRKSCFVCEKTSITKLVTDQNLFESEVVSPKRFEIKESISYLGSTEKGTILHDIMEKISFDFNDEQIFDFISKYFEKRNIQLDETFTLDFVFRKIKKAISLLESIIPKENKTFKEKEFIMKISPFEFKVSEIKDEILVQGKIDLLSVGQKTIIVDYKYSSALSDDEIKSKYEGQIMAYKTATEKALGKNCNIEMYFLLLKNEKLLKV